MLAQLLLGTARPRTPRPSLIAGLNGTSVTGKGFVHVAKLPRLVELKANETPLADAGLEHLTGLRHLDRVYFNGTRLTDRGMETLAGIPSLLRVEVDRTAVTDDGLRKFKAGRPDRVTVPEP